VVSRWSVDFLFDLVKHFASKINLFSAQHLGDCSYTHLVHFSCVRLEGFYCSMRKGSLLHYFSSSPATATPNTCRSQGSKGTSDGVSPAPTVPAASPGGKKRKSDDQVVSDVRSKMQRVLGDATDKKAESYK
jgi:hypothetical protein